MRTLVILALFASSGLAWPQAPKVVADPSLRQELLAMRDEDQRARQAFMNLSAEERRSPTIGAEMGNIDRANTKRLKEILSQKGWPTVSMVGEDGATAAWLLVQHADQDRSFQRQVLVLMEPLVPKGEASAPNYAYLYDRVSEPQRYGTQGRCTGPGNWEPNQIESPDGVDARRTSAGIKPAKFAEYKAIMDAICK